MSKRVGLTEWALSVTSQQSIPLSDPDANREIRKDYFVNVLKYCNPSHRWRCYGEFHFYAQLSITSIECFQTLYSIQYDTSEPVKTQIRRLIATYCTKYTLLLALVCARVCSNDKPGLFLTSLP